MTTVSVITLGCDKNTVDSERMLAELADYGLSPVRTPADAEVIVVNTCGFIDAAKRESIDSIIEAGRLKEHGACRVLAAVGCMVERHEAELARRASGRAVVLGRSPARALSEGERRVRPRMRVLRDPAHAREASLVHA